MDRRFDHYQNLAKRTANNDLTPSQELSNYALGLVGEAGELVDLVKKFLFHGHDLDQGAIKDEAGDCLWYLAVLLDRAGISFEDVARANIEKLRIRYPGGFTSADSIERRDVKGK